MALTTEFKPLQLDELRREAAVMKADGWRFIQTHAVNTDDGVDLYYSFMKDGHVVNLWIQGVQKGTPVPSVTDLFLAAFVFENEARELFGVDMRDIALDFQGAMYAPAINEPMTFMTPEQKSAREKARAKAQAAQAAPSPEAPAAEGDGGPQGAPVASSAATGMRVFVMTPERQARLDAKMPTLSAEKRAKVEAALKARAAEAEAAAQGAAATPADSPESKAPAAAPDVEQPAEKPETASEAEESAASAQPTAEQAKQPVDAELEQKLAGMDPAKAATVRKALGLGGAEAAPAVQPAQPASLETAIADDQVSAIINNMDDAKAAKVRAALAAKGGE